MFRVVKLVSISLDNQHWLLSELVTVKCLLGWCIRGDCYIRVSHCLQFWKLKSMIEVCYAHKHYQYLLSKLWLVYWFISCIEIFLIDTLSIHEMKFKLMTTGIPSSVKLWWIWWFKPKIYPPIACYIWQKLWTELKFAKKFFCLRDLVSRFSFIHYLQT